MSARSFVRNFKQKMASLIGFLRKLNGNLPAEPEQRPHFILGKQYPRTRPTTPENTPPMEKGRKGFIGTTLLQWGVSHPMGGAFTTCTAMFGSGVRIGSAIIRNKTLLTHRVRI